MRIFRPIWAEINCDNLVHNLGEMRARAGAATRLMAVVKADAYGHGATAVARVLGAAGADSFAVASLEEAISLREAGIEKDILVLGYTQTAWASEVVEYRVAQALYHHDLALALSREAEKRGRRVKAHVKIDTGMGRVGIAPENAIHFIMGISELPGIEVEGVFTHFSCADSPDDDYTPGQIAAFERLLKEIEAAGLTIKLRHAANSAGALRYPASRLDMVRPGITLYGLFPSEAMRTQSVDLRPVMSIKSRVVELKTVPRGARISYSGTFTAEGPRRIATLPVGYADGFTRRLSNRGFALIAGRRAPIVGNVCMDFIMADVTGAPDVKLNDEATLIGRQGREEISVEEIAALMDTINYEVVTLIGKRVPRVYTHYSSGSLLDIGK